MPTAKDLQALADREVVELAKAGREAAYRELLRRYERPVFSLIFRMVRDRTLAEDLAQETFIKVLNALDSYRPEYKFSSWIFKIANNAAIDQLGAASSTPCRSTGPRTRARPTRSRPPPCRPPTAASRRSRSWNRARRARPSRRPLRGSARSTGRPSCCATSRAVPTRKSPKSWTCRWGP